MLLTHMSGQSVTDGRSKVDIRHVLAAKQEPCNRKGITEYVINSSAMTFVVTVVNTTYYLNKGELGLSNGNHYSTHETLDRYHGCKHAFKSKEIALIYHDANGCFCGDNMVVLDGSERFVDISGLAGHRENLRRIITAKALIETN
jgi:hypothetical protein